MVLLGKVLLLLHMPRHLIHHRHFPLRLGRHGKTTPRVIVVHVDIDVEILDMRVVLPRGARACALICRSRHIRRGLRDGGGR